MGVDFYGYSCVRTEPIPAKYRPKTKLWSKEAQEEFERDIKWLSQDEQALVLALKGISRDLAGRYVYPLEIEFDDALVDEFHTEYGAKEDYIGVCWQKNRIYFKTPETKEGAAGRSYSGYGDFRNTLTRLYKVPAHLMPYLPPSTDSAPEHGFVDAEQCMSCLKGLDQVRDKFVARDWLPDPEKFGINTDHRFEDKTDDLHEDSWFFREFYSTMYVGANGGVVLVS